MSSQPAHQQKYQHYGLGKLSLLLSLLSVHLAAVEVPRPEAADDGHIKIKERVLNSTRLDSIPTGRVHNLSSDLLIAATNASKSTHGFIVFFGTDWCGHCKNFKPVFDQMASDLHAKEDGTPKPMFIYQQVEKGQDYASKAFRVQGYPTLVYIYNNTYWTYKGKREPSIIFDWIDNIRIGNITEGKPYPLGAPTFLENISEGYQDMVISLKGYYHTSPVMFFTILIIIVAVFSLCIAACYQLFTEEGEDVVCTPAETPIIKPVGKLKTD